MKKLYKELEKIYIGSSDIGAVVLKGHTMPYGNYDAYVLNFGEDGNYNAYWIDQIDMQEFGYEKVDIPEYYHKRVTFINFLDIEDDDGLIRRFLIPKDIQINIYRAGSMGCIFEQERQEIRYVR